VVLLRLGQRRFANGKAINFTPIFGDAVTDAVVYGININITSEISSVTLVEYTATSAGKYRIYRRDMA